MSNRQCTICLNMIVKNESHIIRKTLEHLQNIIDFDYWVICDTGSTDNTKEIIQDYFDSVGISGELVTHEWKGFDVCRSYALSCAYNKTDYVLIFDADDFIHGNLQVPFNADGILDKDMYYLRLDKHNAYYRPLLVNNRIRWKFKGVLHEYIVNVDPISKGSIYVNGDYYIESGKSGSRSTNPTKYLDDARLLETAIENETDDKGLRERYVYYCAQSFYDANQLKESKHYYKRVLSQDNWNQEKYIACMRIGDIYNKLGKHEMAISYWDGASQFDQTRLECPARIIQHYYFKTNHNMVIYYYNKYKHTSQIIDNTPYLLLDTNAYNQIRYFASVSASYTGNPYIGYECCKYLIVNKIPLDVNNVVFNMSFYMKEIENDASSQSEKRELISNIYIHMKKQLPNNEKYAQQIWSYVNKYLKQYTPELFTEGKQLLQIHDDYNSVVYENNKKINTDSKKILFYVGYSNEPWNYSLLSKKAVGGSEKAAAYLTHEMIQLLNDESKNNDVNKPWEIYVAGGVEEAMNNDGINYINLNNLDKFIQNNEFHTVVVSRYVSFMELYQNIVTENIYLWAHDTTFLSYGSSLSSEEIINKWNKSITGCICLTEWHKNIIIKQFSLLKDKIHIINNGINPDFICDAPVNAKQKHSFIYSSCAERGLDRLLQIWPSIKERLPDATLHICSYNPFPKNQSEERMKKIIDNYDSITHHGRLATNELYNLMSKCEYWLYPTSFCETSCITSLEMMAHNVICLYYPLAGLVNTVGEFGIQVQFNTELDTLISIDSNEKEKQIIREKAKKYVLDCSWKNRAEKWINLFNLNNSENSKNWIFYCPKYFEQKMLSDYITNLNYYYNNKYQILLTCDEKLIYKLKPKKITYVYVITDDLDFKEIPDCEISFLNTEPLNILDRFNNVKSVRINNTITEYYDYSKSNIKILQDKNILFNSMKYLPYYTNPEEVDLLKKLNNNTHKKYDFGILKASGGYLQKRRQDIVDVLLSKGFTVSLINGWGIDRDVKLSECKYILNIHGDFKGEITTIFEHIRCDRLLEAGYNVLSETCYELDAEFIKKYDNLILIKYDDFSNSSKIENLINKNNNATQIIDKKNVCFIHSCYIEGAGLNRLQYLLNKIISSGLIDKIYKIFICNIGIELTEKELFSLSNTNISNYKCRISIENISNNCKLYEIPTINKIYDFVNNNYNDQLNKQEYNILYLHTKGISYDDYNVKENNWIDMMLYFLVEKYENCINYLFDYDAIGCNYYNEYYENRKIPHFSGNFWWANSTYLKKLDKIEVTNSPNDAEYWVYKKSPKIYELHNSGVDHYVNEYPREMYTNESNIQLQKKNVVMKKLNSFKSSAWLGHLEFANWISNKLNPSVTVDLGVDYGHSTFAFCSANKGHVYGIDSFDGDIQAGLKNTYNEVITFKQDLIDKGLICDNVTFIKGYFDDVCETFDKKIDILHIDGLHTYEAVSNDYDKWNGKVSDDGVILFHDVMSYKDSVGKVFDSLPYYKFYFTHSAGLGVVCKTFDVYKKLLSSHDMPNKEHIITNSRKIVDAFIFYNELTLLEYRLNILYDVVDYFIIVESTHTFSGKEKRLYYKENKEKFDKFSDKIIHIIVDDMPFIYPTINTDNGEQWLNETHQRNAISRGLDKINLVGNDIIFMTDVDEIINPKIINKNQFISASTNNSGSIMKTIEMDFYYYNLKNKLDNNCYCGNMLTYDKYISFNKNVQTIRSMIHEVLRNGGWHLSYFGDARFIKNKIENFSHQEFNKNKFTNIDAINDKINNSKDLFDRENDSITKISISDNKNLPYKYNVYLQEFI